MTNLYFQRGDDVIERIADEIVPDDATETVVRIVEVTQNGKVVRTETGNEYDRLTGQCMSKRPSYQSIRSNTVRQRPGVPHTILRSTSHG